MNGLLFCVLLLQKKERISETERQWKLIDELSKLRGQTFPRNVYPPEQQKSASGAWQGDQTNL
jgi:hypothetical protein